MVGPMMWFKREPKAVSEKNVENGVVGKLRRKKAVLLKPTRESSERETSTESEKEKRRYSDILDIKVSQDRRDESDESLYESADCHSDAISASDDALPRLGKTPTMSKESLKLAVTDEEVDLTKNKKGHRKTMSLSNPLEIVKTLGDEWFDTTKKELEKNDKLKSRESLWSEEDRDSIHGSTIKLDQIRRDSKKESIKSQSSSRKSSTNEVPKSRKTSKGSSVSALNFLRRKKTPTTTVKAVEAVAEVVDKVISTDELLNYTKLFLEEEKRYSSVRESKPPIETDSDEEMPSPMPIGDQRRRLSRQTSRSKSKMRGKSQTVKVNTLRKSHSGTLKKGKKKSVKTPSIGRSRQASVVEQTPILKKKSSDSTRQNSWLFSASKGEPRREGSTDEPSAPDADLDTSDTVAKEQPDKDNNWRTSSASNARGVNRAESCRERDAPRRGKHRNASDPNRLTAHNNHDLEPGAATAPSGSSSSSSLSSRSNESNTVADQQASQSDWSEEDEPLAAQWADSLPPSVLDALLLSARMRKRQEVIHELIVSEGSHVRWLKVLGGVFLRPLEAAPALLPPDELRALLPNLPGVRERHARLYGELRTARNEAPNHIVQIRPVATAMLNTLGEAGYSPCLARFCRGQRMALDALKERRRKSKELHQFLFSREQLPLCGRLQLRDLLACVWQRLTKYQLLLEGILKTVSETDCEEDGDSEDDVVQLRRALDIAKDVLQNVDTAICTAENEHRLRTIQSKLEVRIPLAGSEWDEPRRLDLTHHALRMEGELSIRNDSNKKMSVLALMLDDSLVLLQREGDKFILKPIPQPSQQGLLSPLIKWDKVLFRPNAATRNAFFLMNINGVQMHELSTKTTTEYTSWVKHMAELPLAKPELRPSLAPLVPLAPLAPLTPLTPLAPAHAPSKSNDDSGINVSRNPSDASEKSNSTAPGDEAECERDRVSLSAERERDEKSSVEREERRSVDKEEASERDEKHKPRRPTVGRISTHGAAPLEPRAALGVAAPAAQELAHTALTALTHQERLRRLDEGISRALRAKSAVVSELLGVPSGSFAHVADLAVADSRRAADMPADADSADIHHLLLAAQAQANQLTEMLMRALTVNEAGAVAARAGRAGHCAACAAREPRLRGDNAELSTKLDDAMEAEAELKLSTSLVEQELLEHAAGLEPLGCGADVEDWSVGGAALATRLVGPASGVQGALAALLGALPALLAARAAGRRELAALRDRADALRARRPPGYPLTEEISYPNEGLDQSIQDQPSNGG